MKIHPYLTLQCPRLFSRVLRALSTPVFSFLGGTVLSFSGPEREQIWE
jgi:hypothetical protein